MESRLDLQLVSLCYISVLVYVYVNDIIYVFLYVTSAALEGNARYSRPSTLGFVHVCQGITPYMSVCRSVNCTAHTYIYCKMFMTERDRPLPYGAANASHLPWRCLFCKIQPAASSSICVCVCVSLPPIITLIPLQRHSSQTNRHSDVNGVTVFQFSTSLH